MSDGCGDISKRLSELRDGGARLTAGERLHLWLCAACRRLRAQFAALGEAAARAPEAGPRLSDSAKARIRKSLGH